MSAWLHAIQNAISWSLEQLPSQRGQTMSAGSLPGSEALAQLRQNPVNTLCADCGAPNPDWISINLGILICLECSGQHRNLGTHISKVRSLTLDVCLPAWLTVTKGIGSLRSNEFWEATLPSDAKPGPIAEREVRAKFIQNKYRDKMFIPPVELLTGEDAVGELIGAVQTDGDLMHTLEIVVSHGIARTCADPSGLTPVAAARKAGLSDQVELLLSNDFPG